MRGLTRALSKLALGVSVVASAITGCGGGDDGGTAGNFGGSGNKSGSGGGANSTGVGGLNLGGGGSGNDGGGGGPCKNLQCQQVACTGGKKTTVSGTVFDPSGALPLYNVAVYVPNAELKPITHGPTCDQCNATLSGDPVVSALTDTAGKFVLENVPVGQNIPLVIQVGKWRKKLVLPNVPECADTPLAAADSRLPGSQAEGDLPKIALTTGGADALECLLRKLGIKESEFTPETGAGMIHLYAGSGGTNKYASSMNGGAAFTSAQTFWGSAASLAAYDVVILSCEGGQNPGTKGGSALANLAGYLDLGGRVFASHWHNIWLEKGPAPFPSVATFNHQSDIGNMTADVDQGFPKGAALAQWLVNVGGSTTLGKVDIKDAQHTVDAVNPTYSQRWIYSTSPTSVQYLSANTPLPAADEAKCGRVVFSDIHVSSGDDSSGSVSYPDGCTTQGLTPQEKVLAFMLFDLSSCIIPDDETPLPPPVK